MGLYEKSAAAMPKAIVLRCTECGSMYQTVTGQVAGFLASGWPTCCGYTMRVEDDPPPAPKAPPDSSAELQAKLEQARDGLHHAETRLQEMCARWTDAQRQIDAAKYMTEKARDCERAEAKLEQAERQVEQLVGDVQAVSRDYTDAVHRARAAESALAAAQGALRRCRNLTHLQHCDIGSVRWVGEEVGRIVDEALSAEPRAAPPALPAELSGKGEQPEPCSFCSGSGHVADMQTASIRTDTIPPLVPCPNCTPEGRHG